MIVTVTSDDGSVRDVTLPPHSLVVFRDDGVHITNGRTLKVTHYPLERVMWIEDR